MVRCRWPKLWARRGGNFECMNRRSLLIGLMGVLATQAACQRNAENALRVAALEGVLSPQMLRDFKETLQEAIALKIKNQESLVALFQQLQAWQQSTQTPGNVADWALLSDYWLLPAIQQGLISPLDEVDVVPGWEALPKVWSTLLQRNQQGLLTDTGPIWGSPYRWGHLMMVYDRRVFKRFGWEPTTWADLLEPELQRRISLPDHPRLVLGVLLKALGHSANVPNPATEAGVEAALDTLREQVKVYSTTAYLQSLVVGDIALAVGWSHDIQPLLPRYRYLRAVAPLPGTLLTADVWTKPKLNADESQRAIALSPLEQDWLSYWWQPATVTPLSLLSQGLSPLLLADTMPDFPFELAAGTVMPTSEQLQQSEFIRPLEDAAIANYSQLWQQLRGSEQIVSKARGGVIYKRADRC